MSKMHIIQSVDRILFSALQARTTELYELAKKNHNNNLPFTYKMYTGAGFTRYPLPEAVAFLDTFADEIEPQTNMRRDIIAFLTQFLNLCVSDRALWYLLPESLASQLIVYTKNPLVPADEELVATFKLRHEYKLIKRRLVLLTL